jgi:ribosomal protein S18 acetylase RimI-like enzyme
MERAGAPTFHVVSFFPEEATGLLAELSTAGHRLDWDLVMDTGAGAITAGEPAAPVPGVTVEPLPPGPELWSTVLASFGLFGVEPAQAADQLLAIERDVLAPAGKRWYGVRDERGRLAALASSLTLEGVGYLDNVATYPHARRRGFAGALAAHAARRAIAEGASRVWLLAEPGSPAVGLYERLGFAEVGTLASTKSPRAPAEERDQAPGGGGR